MAEEGGGKVTGIGHIMRLREMLKKWQLRALEPKGVQEKRTGISLSMENRLKNVCTVCESDDESCQSPDPAPDVPRGNLAVYVGPELRRFVIPTTYLSNPAFKVLLEKAEEEYGFEHKGGISFPCEVETFKYILQCVERQKKVGEPNDGLMGSSPRTGA